jgi:Protein of unknown function (DUF4239)
MDRALVWLSALPLLWMALLLLAGAGVAALLAYGIARTIRPADAPVLGGVVASLVGTLFALFVTFLANSVWDDATRAKYAVQAEAGALADARDYLSILPASERAAIVLAIRRYVEEVAEHEWPAMAQGHESLRARTLLAEARSAALAAPPDEDGRARVAVEGVLRALDAAARAREDRLTVAHATVGSLKWSAVLALAVVSLVALSLSLPAAGRQQVVAMGIAALAIGGGLFVVAAHDRPFLGDVAVPPTRLIEAAAALPGAHAP